MITRRKLIMALGVAALTAPFGAFAQQPGKVWRIGFLISRGRAASLDSVMLGSFQRGMRDLGYVEGKNLIMEWRFSEGNTDLLPAMVAELVKLNVDVLVTAGNAATSAARNATSRIPIVMAGTVDPVGSGLVKSLARPGGNITGPSNLSVDLAGKRLEMLLAMTSKASRIGVLGGSSTPASINGMQSTQTAAQKRRVKIVTGAAQTPKEIESAVLRMVREKVSALIVLINPLFIQQREQIAELAARYRLATMSADSIFVEAGCLMSYGDSLRDGFRRSAIYVDKIFKGANPAELPVEEPTRLELVINRKTATALGLTIPKELLLQADRMLE